MKMYDKMEKNGHNYTLEFSKVFLDELKETKPDECMVGNIIVNKEVLPLICVNLYHKDSQDYGIKMNFPQYDWRFRYLNDDNKNELIEIGLRFAGNKILSILLDPLDNNCRQFTQLIYQKRNFGIFFYSKDTRLFTGTISFTDGVSQDWLKRNNSRMMMLKVNNFDSVIKTRTWKRTFNEKFIVMKRDNSKGLFVTPKDEIIRFEEVNKYLFS